MTAPVDYKDLLWKLVIDIERVLQHQDRVVYKSSYEKLYDTLDEIYQKVGIR